MVARLRRPGFVQNVLILAGGAAGAQLVNVAVAPVLTRLYAPTEIAQLGLFLAFVSVGAIVASLRYEQALVVAQSPADAARLGRLAALLAIPAAIVGMVTGYLLVTYAIAGFGELPLVVIPLVGIAIVAAGWFAILRYWLVRGHAYRVIAEVQLAQSVVRGGGQTVLGLLGFSVFGLIASDALGRLAGLFRMFRASRVALGEASAAPSSSMAALAREYWRFPALGVPSSLVNALAVVLPVPILAGTYGLVVAGYFVLVQRVLSLPLGVIGASVGDALFARVAEQARDAPDRVGSTFRRTGLMLVVIAVPVAAVLALVATPVFSVAFGAEWGEAGRMAGLLSPWLGAALVVSPLSRVVLVFQGQGSKLLYDLAALVAAAVGILVPWGLGMDWPDAMLSFAGMQVLAYAIYFVVLVRLVRRAGADVRRPDCGL